jgi:hypothetical protein
VKSFKKSRGGKINVSANPDKDFLREIKKEIEDLDKELRRKNQLEDLNVSSDSVKSSQELSSEFSLSESYQESPRNTKSPVLQKSRVSLPNLKNLLPQGKSLNDKEKIRELEK